MARVAGENGRRQVLGAPPFSSLPTLENKRVILARWRWQAASSRREERMGRFLGFFFSLILLAAGSACRPSRPAQKAPETCATCAPYTLYTVVSHTVGANSDSFVLRQGSTSLGVHCGWTLTGEVGNERVSENCSIPPPGATVYLRREPWKGTARMADSLHSEAGVVLVLDWEKSN